MMEPFHKEEIKMITWLERWLGRSKPPRRAALAAANINDGFYEAAAERRDRLTFDRAELLAQALDAWRSNPLARRIIALTTQHVLGSGLTLACDHPETAAFLSEFWEHPLNRMEQRLYEWCDELSRAGNLFVLLSTDASGMSYVRAIPAAEIEQIEARGNDVEQALRFTGREGEWPAYDPLRDARLPGGGFTPCVLHYAVNRPAGAQWGESDLGPLLRWLARYTAWLEDRVRLNRYRNTFMYVVTSRYASEEERAARQAALAAVPPSPGAILVTDESESWQVINPQLESAEAALDGEALKKMVAAGAGVPMHFLAEPEDATRTTAEAANGPAYRAFEQRQRQFLWLVEDLLRAVLRRRALVDGRVQAAAPLRLRGEEISLRDRQAQAGALAAAAPVFLNLHERGLLADGELLRLVYSLAGEELPHD